MHGSDFEVELSSFKGHLIHVTKLMETSNLKSGNKNQTFGAKV